jgi:CheY-like chemotaxis protein
MFEMNYANECCEKLKRDIVLDNHLKGESVIAVSVHDEGIGLTAEQHKKLFEPFYQAQESTVDGSGLGLFLVREIAKKSKGHLCCSSEIHRGSTFTFAFPARCPDKSALNMRESESYSKFEQKISINEKILIVEDNKIGQMVVSNMLRRMGHSFDVAENGEIACRMFEENEYFLILMDLMMPVMDGYDATKAICASLKFALKRTVIVALTASVSDQEIHRAKQAGCVRVIAKPVEFETLRETIIDSMHVYASNKHSVN